MRPLRYWQPSLLNRLHCPKASADGLREILGHTQHQHDSSALVSDLPGRPCSSAEFRSQRQRQIAPAQFNLATLPPANSTAAVSCALLPYQ